MRADVKAPPMGAPSGKGHAYAPASVHCACTVQTMYFREFTEAHV